MADRKNTPWDAMAERVAETIKRQLNKQHDSSEQTKQLVAQQQQTNEHLQKLLASTEAQTQEFRHWRETTRRSGTKTFLRKMALEIPPVVIAVLLAFGINSWWQQRRADLAAEKAYRNIISELKINLGTCKYIVQVEEDNLQKLDSGIQKVAQGEINLDENYGGGFMTIPLRSAAWQTASISNALSNFEDSLMIDMASAYEFIEAQENYIQLTTTLDLSQRFTEEELLPFLKTNYALLGGHIKSTDITIEKIQDFLEKYGELDAEPELDE